MARSHPLVLSFILFLAQQALAFQSKPSANQLSGEEITERVVPSVVLILVGHGGERPTGVGSGIILRSEGIIFTAYHVIKDAQQAQVRLRNGEIYDDVELVGFDDRRDIAALRIAASGLPALAVAPLTEVKSGATIYVISNPQGLGWSVSSGVLSGVRLSDEVPGAGSGYNLLQFTAPVSPGSSGGVVVDAEARALGIVVGTESGGQNLNFAVPVESVLGLADSRERVRLGSGRALSLEGIPELRTRPTQPSPAEVAAPAALAPEEPSRKLYLEYKEQTYADKVTAALENELMKHPDFKALGLVITRNRALADLIIELDRSWWDFTFSIVDLETGVVVGAGKEIAWDEVRAARGLAKKIMTRLKARYGSPPEDKPRKKH